MATLVKPKRKEKKKSKSSSERASHVDVATDLSSSPAIKEFQEASNNDTVTSDERPFDSVVACTENEPQAISITETVVPLVSEENSSTNSTVNSMILNKKCGILIDYAEESRENVLSLENRGIENNYQITDVGNTFEDLNRRLETMFKPIDNIAKESEGLENVHETEELVPSAPIFEIGEENSDVNQILCLNEKKKSRIPCMPLEEAIRLYGGKEFDEIRTLSEREEAIVESGPVSGPEHPLIDLLSTFRTSLTAVECERTNLARSHIEEEKYRMSLWKLEKRYINQSEKCTCGATVYLKASYEHAQLLRDKLPIARMKLEAILRDVQESYCHHQHAALLAHCQIEELIAETIKCNKNVIREALSLILQALRLSEGSPAALSSALQRWARALSEALLDGRDVRQLMFFIHNLFRQVRSVRWAASLIKWHVGDSCEAAQVIALMELLLTKTRVDSALECTEDCEEAWEEVDKRGEGGAVSEGALRERDLLKLLQAFPLRDLLARIVLFKRSDNISETRDESWGDRAGGRGVVKACCGIRALLACVARAMRTHSAYARLQVALHTLAMTALHALAALHLHSRSFYLGDLEDRIKSELEACFTLGFSIVDGDKLHTLPASLLTEDSAQDYCLSLISSLHDDSPKRLESLGVVLPVVGCALRVRIVVQATLDRPDDPLLAANVLEFLIRIGVKRKQPSCKGLCEERARESIPLLLQTHPYLHATALHILAGFNQGNPLEPCSVDALAVHQWRPTRVEALAVLDDWSRRCPQVLRHLLLQLDYTPHTGISLECQLAIGSWLCQWEQQSPGEAPDWAWSVLRKLQVHRTSWSLPLDAPSPEEPADLFSAGFTLLSSSWGHCIPLVCERGAAALCCVASSRPLDAAHLLAPIMLVMAQSPESLDHTDKFTELFNILLVSGPSLMQRALGRGGESGSTLLLRIILAQLENDQCGGVPRGAILSAWAHALGKLSAGLILLDTAVLACGEFVQLDRYTASIMQEKNAKAYVDEVLRACASCPLVAESVLRMSQATHAHVFDRVCAALMAQRARANKIHVDNALKQIDPNISSEELVIYRTAAAVLVVPFNHPAHLALWRLFFQLYLQRSRFGNSELPAVGPLFFTGLIKSRTMGQLKKRLQDTAKYHENEAESLKKKNVTRTNAQVSSEREIVPSSVEVVEENFLPALSIVDLTGQSSESSDSDDDDMFNERKPQSPEASKLETSKDYREDLLQYHLLAERIVKTYSQWLEEGENVRAQPVHVALMPDQLVEVARQHAMRPLRPPATPPNTPVDVSSRPQVLPPNRTPLQKTIDSLMALTNGPRNRSRARNIRSALEDVNFKDHRSVLCKVDAHLKDIERLANDWSSERSRVTSMDARLLELVCVLRVGRPLAPITKKCPNKCRTIKFVEQANEWCISPGAEHGIKENRASAHAAMRRLSRARPHAAHTVATLTSIARRVESGDLALKILEHAWRAACLVSDCAPAHLAITNLLNDLSERWVCHDGRLSASLVSRWCSGTATQRSLIGSLVNPRRVPAADWPSLYTAVLRAADCLPSHSVFSYLSKFELSRWSEVAQQNHRHEMLEALMVAVCRWGPTPDQQHQILLELLGVHTLTLSDANELCSVVRGCARAAVARNLPPTHWPYVVRAVRAHAKHLTFDQLGHLLREVGVMWWEARSLPATRVKFEYAAYAQHIAALLHALQRAFVAAALALSYEPSRVGLYAWSSISESWSPWVSPHPAVPPLLGGGGSSPEEGQNSMAEVQIDPYTQMLRHFVDTIKQVMIDCPGSDSEMLRQVFEFAIQNHSTASPSGNSSSRAQLSTLLAELGRLPWDQHQWLHPTSLQPALQVCTQTDSEIKAWCSDALRAIGSDSWIRDVADTHLPAHLNTLLYFFITMPLHQQTLEKTYHLPWHILPEPALEHILEKFFIDHHNPAQPYYTLPQFKVLMCASGFVGPNFRAQAAGARALCVSLCARAALSPALHAHLRTHALTMLNIIQTLALSSEISDEELEEILGRAAVVLSMEPAVNETLPVWVEWVSKTNARAVRMCSRAARVLTVLRTFATLADAAARAHLALQEGSWDELVPAWRYGAWDEAGAVVGAGDESLPKLHAAYGTLLAHAAKHTPLAALHALHALNINFAAEEVMVCVWVCVAAREAASKGESSARAHALLTRWAEEPRHAILRAVTLQSSSSVPTDRQRLLCRFALCALASSAKRASLARSLDALSRLLEASARSAEALAWVRSPRPSLVPRLAIALFPDHERYFAEELKLVSEHTDAEDATKN